jgi:hypothetical protein
MHKDTIARQAENALRNALAAPDLHLIELRGNRPAEDEQREPWIPVKYGAATAGDWIGVVVAEAVFEHHPGAMPQTLALVVKVHPRQGAAHTLIPWIVREQHIALDRPYWQYRRAAEFEDAGAREATIYRLAARMPALRPVLPRCYGVATERDAEGEEYAVFLEFLTEVSRLDATGASTDWPAAAIDEALRGAAAWHAAFWDNDAKALAWAGPRPMTEDMLADAPLWRGLLDDARQRFPDVVTETIWRRRHRLIDTIGDWHAAKDRCPGTLAHNDFNQRNVGFRTNGFVALDWECVQRDIAQRDLVELLTFALLPDVERTRVDGHVEAHRSALIEAGIAGVDRAAWIEGFRAELKVEAINRIALQLLFAAQFPLPYLARINATIERLLDLYGESA